jgi:preprotein translocase subunit SecG
MSPLFHNLRAESPMLFTFLLIVHGLVAAALVGVILVQKSEGGGLTSGGSPAGLMSARGAADFLTRTTAILAAVFVALSIVMAVIAATRTSETVDVSAARVAPAAPPPATTAPSAGAPLAGAAATVDANVAAPTADNGVPLER